MSTPSTAAPAATGEAAPELPEITGTTPSRRVRFLAAWGRVRSWEFWPSWAVYAPMVPVFAWLGFRYGLTTPALSNPGIPLGGLIGESKWDTLSVLPPEWIVPSAIIPVGDAEGRLKQLDATIACQGWTYPIVLKPDQGFRGTGVRVIASRREAGEYLAGCRGAVIAQAFHPGPHEVGVFYTRSPGENSGRIFSITGKRFPSVVGDGRSSVAELVWEHPRFRIQAAAHLDRLGPRASRIPAAGETVSLEAIGNHCRGTMFVDAAGLITQDLTAAIDAISRATPGFFFGRFDIRYADEAELRAGRGFKIVELNGLSSESTNIYDPSTGFWQAQRVLRAQWRLAFEIGWANRLRGQVPPRVLDVVRAWWTYQPS